VVLQERENRIYRSKNGENFIKNIIVNFSWSSIVSVFFENESGFHLHVLAYITIEKSFMPLNLD